MNNLVRLYKIKLQKEAKIEAAKPFTADLFIFSKNVGLL